MGLLVLDIKDETERGKERKKRTVLILTLAYLASFGIEMLRLVLRSCVSISEEPVLHKGAYSSFSGRIEE